MIQSLWPRQIGLPQGMATASGEGVEEGRRGSQRVPRGRGRSAQGVFGKHVRSRSKPLLRAARGVQNAVALAIRRECGDHFVAARHAHGHESAASAAPTFWQVRQLLVHPHGHKLLATTSHGHDMDATHLEQFDQSLLSRWAVASSESRPATNWAHCRSRYARRHNNVVAADPSAWPPGCADRSCRAGAESGAARALER
jgi:hypothetical protein